MPLVIGLLAALAAASLTWQIAAAALANLPAALGHAILLALVALSALVGFVAGSAVSRRARRSREHLRLFGALAFGVAGGILGAAFMVALTAAYMHTYAQAPQSVIETILVVLAYPVLGALGFAVGSLGASLVGLFAAGVLGVVSPARR